MTITIAVAAPSAARFSVVVPTTSSLRIDLFSPTHPNETGPARAGPGSHQREPPRSASERVGHGGRGRADEKQLCRAAQGRLVIRDHDRIGEAGAAGDGRIWIGQGAGCR